MSKIGEDRPSSTDDSERSGNPQEVPDTDTFTPIPLQCQYLTKIENHETRIISDSIQMQRGGEGGKGKEKM